MKIEKKLIFDLKYSKITDENKNIVDNKYSVDLTLNSELLIDKTYSLKILKSINKSLKQDYVKTFRTLLN